MSERRRFNRGERSALYLAADGRCQRCGRELAPGWHADHVMPYVAGGPTDVINGQALCPRCNLRKGSYVNDLRAWQEQALRDFSLWQPQDGEGFLVEATPGAGKTRYAIAVAQRLLAAGRIDQIVIAVPTSRLEEQWAEEFARHGVSINPTWHAADGRLASDEHGCAATYAEIAKSSQNFRRLCSVRRTLVILDEVHHCGGDRSWGSGTKDAFERAEVKLLLSGTPFRSDNDEIPFVNYVDGVGVPDHRYGYRRALADGVVRAVFFPRRGGKMEWTSHQGERQAATFDDELGNREAAYRLRTAISPSGEWLPSVLKDADSQLTELREFDSTAAGIVFCEDSITARSISDMLTRMGRSPVLAIQEEAEADDRIKQFKDSTDSWIVTIRKVSEGVDIPRLRVGVYATPWVTELFFRQVVGRLVRVRPGEEDQTGYLFIPDDHRLRAMAEQIKVVRDHVLDAQADELTGHDVTNDPGEGGELFSKFAPISAVATDQGMIVDDDTVSPEEIAEAERVKKLDPATAVMPTALVARLLRNAGGGPAAPAAEGAATAAEPAPYERKDSLRKTNNTIAARIAKAHGVDHKVVNGTLNRAAGLPVSRGTKRASEPELERRLKLAQQWLSTGQAPGA